MPRTTIDLDLTILRELKRRQQLEGKSLGRLASELLAAALERSVREGPPPFVWTATPMDIRVDLEDKEAVRQA